VRLLKGAMYRLAFVPMIIALLVGVLVFAATHPPQAALAMAPNQFGIYCEPVSMARDDGHRIAGTMVPVIDAQRVLAEKDQFLRHKYPVVILVHSMGTTSEQTWPLVRPLHEAGMVVLSLDLGGSGRFESAVTAQTFGLSEWRDIECALQMVRNRPFVDAHRIALVGIGSGANAALLAASRNPQVAALVLGSPIDLHQALDRFIDNGSPLHGLQPLCRLTFEIAYRVDLDDLRLDRYTDVLKCRPVLMLDHLNPADGLSTREVSQVQAFLQRHLEGE
jgi:pimeloyl-ACP methyl ester carboxylesterase